MNSQGEGKEESRESGSPFLRVFDHIRRGGVRDEPPDEDAGRQQGPIMRRARRVVRRNVRLSLADIYLQLGAALAERGRFEEAAEAFENAMREGGVSAEDVLDDLAHSAERAGARDLALRARLELAVVRPERAQDLTAQAGELFDEGVAAAEGRWILEAWRPRIQQQQLSVPARFEVALLAGRAAMLQGYDAQAVGLLAEAAAEAPEAARHAARTVLQAESLPERWRTDDPQGHWLRAEAYRALGAGDDAVKEANAALAAATPGEDLGLEVAVLELKVEHLEASERNAEAAAALVDLGRRRDMQIEHRLAVHAYTRATELDPDNAEAWWYLGDSRRLVAAALEADGERAEDELRQAREALHAGLARRDPTAAEAWVYWAAALLAEATWTSADDEALFEAALCAEHGVALSPFAPGLWALVVRYYRMLGKPTTAMIALDRAVETSPDDEDVIRERMLALVELGLENATDALDDFELRFPAAPTSGVRGFVLLNAGRHAEAAAALSAALEQQPDDPVVRIYRALALALSGDVDAARADASRVFELTDPTNPEHRHSRGWAAVLTRQADEARAMFEGELRSSVADPVEARLGLACAEQLAGDGARASALVSEAAELALYPRHAVSGALTLEIAERLGASIAVQDDPPLFQAAANRVAARAYSGLDALDELAAVEGTSADSDPRWVAAVAGRARVNAMFGRSSDAADAYEALLARPGRAELPPLMRFAPAHDGAVAMLNEEIAEAVATDDRDRAERAHVRLVALGAATDSTLPLRVAAVHRAAGRLEGALQALEPLRAAEGGSAEIAQAWRDSGDLLLALGRPDAAIDMYERALGRIDAGALEQRAALQTRLGVAAAAARDTARAVDFLREALATVRDVEGRTRAAQAVIAVCSELTAFAGAPLLLPATLRKLFEHEGESRGQRRRLTSAWFGSIRARDEAGEAAETLFPLVLEADEGLFPAGAETEGVPELLEESMPAMRDRIRRETGVLIPGLRIQTSPLLPGEFRVHLHGVPYTRDPVPDEAVFAAMLSRVEELVRSHLHRFVSLAEIDYMVEEWRVVDEPRHSELVSAALPNQGARIRLAAVVRALVREGVSVAEFGTVLDAFAAAGSVEDAADTVRAAILERSRASERMEVLG